jgi:transcriptional regulator with XRE-family HTH domain
VRKGDSNIGTRLQALRKQTGLTQEQLGVIADLHPSYVGQIERGYRYPSLKALTQIAHALSVPLTHLLDDDIVTPVTVERQEILWKELRAVMKGRSPQDLRKLVALARLVFQDEPTE